MFVMRFVEVATCAAAFTPAEAGTRFSNAGGMQGWVDLCYVKEDRLGIEPATCKSQVQHPTPEPPRNTSVLNWQDQR